MLITESDKQPVFLYSLVCFRTLYVLGLAADRGSITTGKRADLVILNAPNWKHIIYQLGNHQNLINKTIINGQVVLDTA